MSGFVRQNACQCAFTSADSWVILNPIEQSIKRKIEAIGTPLKDWDIKINRGILTGCNEAFIIDQQKRDELVREDPKSAELIRPILRGRDIKRYSYEWAHLYILAMFPALHIDIEQYPAVKRHLLSFGIERLEQTGKEYTINGEKIHSRKKTGNKWFETQDQIGYWDDFNKQKIIWGEISDKTKFALDTHGDFYAEATTFLMTGEWLTFLTCFLNSLLSEYLFSKIGTTTGVGTVRWKKFKIEQLYVPKINDFIEREFAEIINAEDTNLISEIVNQKIYQLCALSDEEISFIQEFMTKYR